MQLNIFGTSDRGISDPSYGRFKAIRHKFHYQLPPKEPLVIGRNGWIQRTLSGHTKDYNLTSKPST